MRRISTHFSYFQAFLGILFLSVCFSTALQAQALIGTSWKASGSLGATLTTTFQADSLTMNFVDGDDLVFRFYKTNGDTTDNPAYWQQISNGQYLFHFATTQDLGGLCPDDTFYVSYSISNNVLTMDDVDGCSLITAAFMGSTWSASDGGFTGIENELSADFSLYPNPAQNTIYIQANSVGATGFVIYNTVGQIVKEIRPIKLQSVSVSDLPAGFYYLHAETGGSQLHPSIKFCVVR